MICALQFGSKIILPGDTPNPILVGLLKSRGIEVRQRMWGDENSINMGQDRIMPMPLPASHPPIPEEDPTPGPIEGFRKDFYKMENIIGWSGDIAHCPSVYFRAGHSYGRITQLHEYRINLGREVVNTSEHYFQWNIDPATDFPNFFIVSDVKERWVAKPDPECIARSLEIDTHGGHISRGLIKYLSSDSERELLKPCLYHYKRRKCVYFETNFVIDPRSSVQKVIEYKLPGKYPNLQSPQGRCPCACHKSGAVTCVRGCCGEENSR